MRRFNRPSRRRRRRVTIRPGHAPPVNRPAISYGLMAAITLLLVAVPILLYSQQHSGNHPFKMRREMRKF